MSPDSTDTPTPAPPRSSSWADLRSPEFDDLVAGDPARYVVLLPIGAIEQHGKHLPVDVDIHAARAVCEEVARRDGGVLVAPSVDWGVSHGHLGFRGTISLRPETLLHLLRDICSSILQSGFKSLILVNGHNGNRYMAGQVVAELPRDPGVFMGFVTYFELALEEFRQRRQSGLGGEAHAGEFETSLEQYLHADAIGPARDVRYVESLSEKGFVDLAVRGPLEHGFGAMKTVFPEGVMGDPSAASAELGKILFDTAASGLCDIVTEARRFATNHLHHAATGVSAQ